MPLKWINLNKTLFVILTHSVSLCFTLDLSLYIYIYIITVLVVIFLTAWWLLFCIKLHETQEAQSKFHIYIYIYIYILYSGINKRIKLITLIILQRRIKVFNRVAKRLGFFVCLFLFCFCFVFVFWGVF